MFRGFLVSAFTIIMMFSLTSCADPVTSTPTNDEYEPARPTELKITSPSIETLILRWQDNCSLEKSYIIERRHFEVGQKPNSVWTIVAELPPNSNSFTDLDVEYGHEYNYKVYAFFDEETQSGSTILCYQMLPAPVENLKTVLMSVNSLKLSWNLEQSWVRYRITKYTSEDWLEPWITLEAGTDEYIRTDLDLSIPQRFLVRCFLADDYSQSKYTGYNRIEMVYVEGDTFTMGNTWENNAGVADEYPSHEVTLTSFYIGKYEVTGLSNKLFTGIGLYGHSNSWAFINAYQNYAYEFCNYLSEMEGLNPSYSIGEFDDEYFNVEFDSTANGYRLPTEAEWEYAARGGVHSEDNYLYSGSNDFDEVGITTMHGGQIGTKAPNQLGIHDMSGNAFELCWGFYGPYSAEHQTNPLGPSEGDFRIVRGDGSSSVSARCASNLKSTKCVQSGFRVARNAE